MVEDIIPSHRFTGLVLGLEHTDRRGAGGTQVGSDRSASSYLLQFRPEKESSPRLITL